MLAQLLELGKWTINGSFPTLASAIKHLKGKLHLCESIDGRMGEREVMSYSGVVLLQKRAERGRAL